MPDGIKKVVIKDKDIDGDGIADRFAATITTMASSDFEIPFNPVRDNPRITDGIERGTNYGGSLRTRYFSSKEKKWIVDHHQFQLKKGEICPKDNSECLPYRHSYTIKINDTAIMTISMGRYSNEYSDIEMELIPLKRRD